MPPVILLFILFKKIKVLFKNSFSFSLSPWSAQGLILYGMYRVQGSGCSGSAWEHLRVVQGGMWEV